MSCRCHRSPVAQRRGASSLVVRLPLPLARGAAPAGSPPSSRRRWPGWRSGAARSLFAPPPLARGRWPAVICAARFPLSCGAAARPWRSGAARPSSLWGCRSGAAPARSPLSSRPRWPGWRSGAARSPLDPPPLARVTSGARRTVFPCVAAVAAATAFDLDGLQRRDATLLRRCRWPGWPSGRSRRSPQWRNDVVSSHVLRVATLAMMAQRCDFRTPLARMASGAARLPVSRLRRHWPRSARRAHLLCRRVCPRMAQPRLAFPSSWRWCG